MTAEEIIEHLGLSPMPLEGGYFKINYLSSEVLPAGSLPDRYSSNRQFGNAIYFLETTEQFSAMHTLITDEIYYHHIGDPLEMLLLYPDGRGEIKLLGNDLAGGHRPQICVPRGTCHGSRPMPEGEWGYSLVSASMAPGWSEDDLTFATRTELLKSHPEFKSYIAELTRSEPINV